MADKKQMDLIPQQGECVVGKFLKKDVRKTFYNGEWWFVLNDIVVALTETKDPSDYMKKVKSRDNGLSEGWGQIVTPLEIDNPSFETAMDKIASTIKIKS
jgi:hypothetical protein